MFYLNWFSYVFVNILCTNATHHLISDRKYGYQATSSINMKYFWGNCLKNDTTEDNILTHTHNTIILLPSHCGVKVLLDPCQVYKTFNWLERKKWMLTFLDVIIICTEQGFWNISILQAVIHWILILFIHVVQRKEAYTSYSIYEAT